MPAADVSVNAWFVYAGVTINGVAWSEFNVDAPGTFTAAATDFGMFYQWGIKVGWSATDPAADVAIDGWNSDNTGAEDDVWTTANDPCPTGWRLPTKDEQATLVDNDPNTGKVFYEWIDEGVKGGKFTDKTGGSTNGNTIFFPAAGGRNGGDGALIAQGIGGVYCPATSGSAYYAWCLDFRSGYAGQANYGRSYGLTVRCVRP